MTTVPVYFLSISQSNGEGNGADSAMDDGFIGPVAGVYIYHNGDVEWQLLQHSKDGDGSVRNNLTVVGAFFGDPDDTPTGTPANPPEEGPQIGPEMSLAPLLRERHPTAPMVLLFKFCKGNSIVGEFAGLDNWRKAEADEWTTMSNRWSAAKSQALSQFSGTVTGFDIKGVFSVIGETDAGGGLATPQSNNPANFYTNMKGVIDDFRDDFTDTSHTTGASSADPIPFILTRIHPDVTPGVVTGLVTAKLWIDLVRAAQDRLAQDLTNVVTINIDDLVFMDPDLFGFSGIHLDAPSQETHGQRMVHEGLNKLYGQHEGGGQGS